MIRVGLVAALCLSGVTSAQAFQRLDDYRIPGDQILAVAAIDPAFEEDPELLRITTQSPDRGLVVLELETDGDATHCAQSLEYMIGDADQYAQIIVDTNAPTLNGTLILMCTAHRLR